MDTIITFRNISLLFPLLIAAACLTLAEQEIIASLQRRKGPNIVGIFGLLLACQPTTGGTPSDAQKPLYTKQVVKTH